jgi:hypothetical protein
VGVYDFLSLLSDGTASQLSTAKKGTIIPTVPNYFPEGIGGLFQPPGIVSQHYYGVDYATLTTQIINVYGVDKTYLALGPPFNFSYKSGNIGLRPLMIWE